MTGDGLPDLVALNQSNQGRVWTGLGNGTFTGPATFGTGSQPYGLAIGDFNRNAKPDVVTANINSNTASVILNAPIPTAIPVAGSAPPVAARLMQNAPNPFNPRTTIRFALTRAGRARLVVFDAAGRRVSTLLDRSLPAGEMSVEWDGRDEVGRTAASGIYFYKLEADGVKLSRKMALLK